MTDRNRDETTGIAVAELGRIEEEPNLLSGGVVYSYVDYLAAYVDAAFPDIVEPPSQGLIEKINAYLLSLTDAVAPPPPDLVDEAMAYLAEQARPAEGFPPFATLKNHVLEEVFARLTPLDLTPLNPAGVPGTIQKLTFGRTARSLKDLIDLLKKGEAKLKELVPPTRIDLTKKHWRREGPFQLIGIDEFAMHRSFLLRHLLPPPGGYTAWSFSREIEAPLNTDTVTGDLSGVSYLLSLKQLAVGADGFVRGRDGSAPEIVFNRQNEMAAITWQLTTRFNRLISDAATFHLNIASPYYRDPPPSDYWITVVARVNARYYSAIIT